MMKVLEGLLGLEYVQALAQCPAMETEGLKFVVTKGIRRMFVVQGIVGRCIVRRIVARMMRMILRRTIFERNKSPRGIRTLFLKGRNFTGHPFTVNTF